jgi:two-component system nitrate/nitrite sensor histidine kinase NarX
LREGVDDRDGSGDLRRLKVIGVALPVFFVLVLELIPFELIQLDLIDRDFFAGYGFHIVLVSFTVLGIVAFSFAMFHFIDRAQAERARVVADLQRRQREGHGLYDVLLRISNQEALAEILAAVARHARELLSADHATVCLNDATTRSLEVDPTHPGAALREGVCVSPDADGSYLLEELGEGRALRSSGDFSESLLVQVQSRDTMLGELWVGRRAARPFSERDQRFLATLSDLASIAVTSARMRESERQGAILAERERIARELHDSMAQVLGATHLRLRALGSRDEAQVDEEIAAELAQLADICEDGYRDARGAILDLHESSQTDRNLLDSLRAYLDKYSQQCGVAASLETALGQDLALPPHSEIQIIRVIQEALTNVRKHSGAVSAAVRVTQANGTVTFVVEDNGCGFDSAEALLDRDGFGLHSMRERMELIGGTLVTDSASGRGTRVVAEVPYPRRGASNPVRLDARVN